MNTTNIIFLQAAECCKLYNDTDRVFVESVMVTDGDTTKWREVTEAEAEALLAEWDKEVERLNAQDDEPATIDE